MKRETKIRVITWITVGLMLLAIMAYVMSLDESEPLPVPHLEKSSEQAD